MSVNWSLPIINETYTSFWGVFEYNNLVSENYFGVGLLLVIAIVSIGRGILSNPGVKTGLTEGGFLTFLATILLGSKNIVSPDVVVSVIILYLGWIAYLIYENK